MTGEGPEQKGIEHSNPSAQMAEGLIDLAPQQRNLMLMRPLFQLELTKNKFSDGNNGALLDGLDTNYISLAALSYMMEGTAVAVGYTLAEVQQYLAQVVGHMKSTLTVTQRNRVAEIVLDSLDNASNNYQEHSYDYFHALTGETRTVRFRFNETNGAHVCPAIDLYRFALDHGSRRSPVIRVSGDEDGAQRWLPELTDQICALWASDCWIPQESLGTEQLFSNWESDPAAREPRVEITAR